MEMKHPRHFEHSLTLRQSPHYWAACYVCRKYIPKEQFIYCCSHGDFDVDIGCAVRTQHFSHKHPLILIEEEKNDDDGEAIVCMVCSQKIIGSAYRCTTCSSYLHKWCAELSAEMEHPRHSEHPLTLQQPRSVYGRCEVCDKRVYGGFTYRCSPCNFDVHTSCAVQAQHFSHEHPLILLLIEDKNDDGEAIVCMVCLQKIAGSAYRCTTCSSYLHKLCAELSTEMEHPRHSEHPLTLQQSQSRFCEVCYKSVCDGFTYRCSPCNYDVHTSCALTFQHFSHKHPLILIEQKNDDGERVYCDGCVHPIRGSAAYRCTICSIYLHRLCGEAPAEMQHPMHSKHPLTLQLQLQQNYGFYLVCHVCHRFFKEGFTYHCFPCDFSVDFSCAMKAQHFSHKHPLILIEKKNDDGEGSSCDAEEKNDDGEGSSCDAEEKNDDGEGSSCGACAKLITGSVYRCTICSLDLHKFCAELLPEIKHPMHPEHPLTLFIHPAFKCNACCTKYFKAFAYRCFLCDFYLDICCAVRAQSVEHESHKHPLSLMLSSASFECHACRTKREDIISYMCNTCSFWIHKDCASLPTTFKHSSHAHPLILVIYSIHEDSNSIRNKCMICEKLISGSVWFYACEGCKYRIHVHCSTKTDEKMVMELEYLGEADLIHLPMPDESVSLIDQFVKQISLGDNKREAKVKHFSHHHPLILFDKQGESDLGFGNQLLTLNEQKNEKTCNACVRQISAPFYSCSLCDFFLHTWCAKLQNELQYKFHPQHQLILLKEPPYPRGLFECVGCGNYCNGFAFGCVKSTCTTHYMEYFLDIKCASLPNAIIHEVHKHPLLLRKDCIITGCVACDRSIGMLSFGCNACNYNLHYTCAMLPHTIRHRYDKHPFILTYTPIKDGPDEYICEFCEGEINPNFWFYHCIDCDQSACAKCIYKEEKEYPNIKWGSIYNLDRHRHPLVVIQAPNKNRLCYFCDRGFTLDGRFGGIAFKCEMCDIILHPDCPHERRVIPYPYAT